MVRLIRAAVSIGLLSAVLVLSSSSSAQSEKLNEYRAKANFLAAFPNFIEWPTDAFSSEKAPFLICVFGDYSFGASLAQITRGVIIRGRRIEIRWIRKEGDLRACQILFVSRSEDGRYAGIFKAIQGASVLTVGETPNFLPSGGAIDFLIEQDGLEFEVNVAAAEGARLKISSNMLALARHVITKTAADRKSRESEMKSGFRVPMTAMTAHATTNDAEESRLVGTSGMSQNRSRCASARWNRTPDERKSEG
jgi:hypothetical protein